MKQQYSDCRGFAAGMRYAASIVEDYRQSTEDGDTLTMVLEAIQKKTPPDVPTNLHGPDLAVGCPDALLPDGPVCPRCGSPRAPSGVGGGSWVHHPRIARGPEIPAGCICGSLWSDVHKDGSHLSGCPHFKPQPGGASDDCLPFVRGAQLPFSTTP